MSGVRGRSRGRAQLSMRLFMRFALTREAPTGVDVGPTGEQCDGNDYDCNGVAGVDDPAPPAPADTLNCAKVFRCASHPSANEWPREP